MKMGLSVTFSSTFGAGSFNDAPGRRTKSRKQEASDVQHHGHELMCGTKSPKMAAKRFTKSLSGDFRTLCISESHHEVAAKCLLQIPEEDA